MELSSCGLSMYEHVNGTIPGRQCLHGKDVCGCMMCLFTCMGGVTFDFRGFFFYASQNKGLCKKILVKMLKKYLKVLMVMNGPYLLLGKVIAIYTILV
jgi:hypothetical protein